MTTAAPLALGACLVVSPQLIGGAYGWGISIIALLAGLACGLAVWVARADGLKSPIDSPTIVVLLALAWTAVQAVPLPRAIIALAQPDALDLADAAARLTGAGEPGWVPLSISPGSTRAEIVKWAAVAGAFFAAWLLANLGHRRRVVQLVGLSTVVMAVVALAHLAADADHVFGVYRPVTPGGPLLAPLVNQNHLSGFLAMGVPVLIGLGLEEEDRGLRIGYLTAGAIVGASALLAVSRGGVAALVCGVLALAALGLARRRGGERRDVGTTLATVGATVAAIAGLGLYVGAEGLYRDFEGGDASKVELAAQGLALSLEHPFIGVGRGAFSAAFVAQTAGDRRFTHPENLLAQWTSEWGLVFALVALGVLCWAILRGIGAARAWTRIGAAAGLAAILVHDLVDFAMEMVGVGVVAAALLAAVVAPRRSSRPRPRRELRAWVGGAAVSVATVASVAIVGWRLDQESVFALQGRLTNLMRAEDRDAFGETLLRAIRLHPAEPAFPLLGGAEATRHDDPRAPAWLNRAMVRAPGWSSPHVETARYLAQRGRFTQAFLEIEAAEERRLGSASGLACTIVQRRPETTPELLRIAGDDELELLERVARCLPLQHTACPAIDARLVALGRSSALVREARRALQAREPRAALQTLAPVHDADDVEVQVTRARALIALGEHGRALRALSRAERVATRLEDVLRLRAEAQAAMGDAEGMRQTMEDLRARTPGEPQPLARAWVAEGRLEESLGNHGLAVRAFHAADRLDPTAGGLAAAASLLERGGDLAGAYRALAELCMRSGANGPSCAARDRLRSRMAESLTQPSQRLGTP